MLRSFSRTLIASLIIAAAGCTSGNNERQPQAVPLPPAYAEMLAQVAAERGLTPPAALRIGTVSRDRLPAVLHANAPEDDTRLARLSIVYRLLGLIPENSSYAEASRAALEGAVGALYVPGRREVWLVRNGPLPGSPSDLEPWERRLLAHEFAHAIQDYHFDIPALRRSVRTTDAWLALHALLEGDAVWTESRWTANVLLPRLSPGAALDAPSAGAYMPPSVAREATFQYVTGAEWVALLRAGDPAAVDRLLRGGPPPATAFALHPELPRTGWVPGGAALPTGAPADGWQPGESDSLGEFLLASYLQTALSALPSIQAAAGWAADTLQLYRDPSGRPALAWRIRFADAKEAGEFAARHRELLERRADRVTESAAMVTARRRDGVTVVQLANQGVEVTIAFAEAHEAALALASFLQNR